MAYWGLLLMPHGIMTCGSSLMIHGLFVIVIDVDIIKLELDCLHHPCLDSFHLLWWAEVAEGGPGYRHHSRGVQGEKPLEEVNGLLKKFQDLSRIRNVVWEVGGVPAAASVVNHQPVHVTPASVIRINGCLKWKERE